MTVEYKRLPIHCDLSIVALEEAGMQLAVSRIYSLYVNASLWPVAVMVIRAIGAAAPNNPFAPHINLHADNRLGRHEWYITDNQGNAVGSEGC